MVDDKGKVKINSPETIAALKFVRELYPNFISRHRELARRQQQPRLPRGEISVTARRCVALLRRQERSQARRHGSRHALREPAHRSDRQVGGAAPDHLRLHLQVHEVSAGGAGLPLLHVRRTADERLDRRVQRLLLPDAQGLRQEPGVDLQPHQRALRQGVRDAAPNGYAGPLGPQSAAAMADWIVVDMVAEAATGQRTPEEAARRAEQRASRIYRG